MLHRRDRQAASPGGGLERPLPYLAHTVEIWEHPFGSNHPMVADVLAHYADLWRRLGDEAGAQEADARAAATRKELEGAEPW